MRVKSVLGQVGMSSRPGSTRPGYIGLAYYFHKECQYEVCYIYKNVQQKVERIMFGAIYIVGLSILFTQQVRLHNWVQDNRKRGRQEIYFCVIYSYYLFKQKRKKSAVPFIMNHIYFYQYMIHAFMLGHIACKIWEVSA